MTTISELFARKAEVEKRMEDIKDNNLAFDERCELDAERDGLNLGIKAINEVKAIIEQLGETRDKSNSLINITLGSFTTNSIQFLKEELKSQLNKEQKQ